MSKASPNSLASSSRVKPATATSKSATSSSRSEISTPLPVVRKMCNLCEPLLSDKTRKMFEPGCGTGNFLAETLSRRLETISNPHDALVALSNLYGADINADYLITARSRLKSIILQRLPGSFLDYRFLPLVDLFLQSNLIQGDLIDHYEKITFVDWQPISEYNFRATPTRLSDMLDQTASALSSKVSAKTAPNLLQNIPEQNHV